MVQELVIACLLGHQCGLAAPNGWGGRSQYAAVSEYCVIGAGIVSVPKTLSIERRSDGSAGIGICFVGQRSFGRRPSS